MILKMIYCSFTNSFDHELNQNRFLLASRPMEQYSICNKSLKKTFFSVSNFNRDRPTVAVIVRKSIKHFFKF